MRAWLPTTAWSLLAVLACAGADAPAGLPDSEPEVTIAKDRTAADDRTPAQRRLVTPPSAVAHTEDEKNTIEVFRAMAPATVFVTQNQLVLDRYSLRATEIPTGAGSGFLWDEQGHVVTNYHVVDGARTLSVTLQDQTVWPAQFVGGDPRKDVAVLKIEAPPESLVPIVLPPPGFELEVGQKTLAIGNPFGLDHTLTTGIVSALGREIVGYGNVTIKGMIQTDASINPGNSGGPLLDSSGRLIGMNTMIFSQAGQSAGIGFAVPHTIVARVVTQIVETGHVTQVGIGIRRLEDRVARRAGIDGLAILEVVPGTPAAKAGLRGFTMTAQGRALVGDVIVGVDDTAIHDYDDFYNAIDPHAPGDVVAITVIRDGKRFSVDLALIELAEED